MEPKSKGIAFVNLKNFIFERYALEGWVDLLAELLPEDRVELESVVSVGWYSTALYARTLRALDLVHGAGDLAILVQLGRYEAEHDLPTIHRAFFRMASPSYFLEKSAEYWRRYHDTGVWTIQRESPTRVRAYLDGWGVVDTALCRDLIGYVARAFELVGGRNVRIDHSQCRAHGDDRCVFLGSWGESPPSR